MLKKMKAASDDTEPASTKDIAQTVIDSSRQIWLAGLGAFSRAQQEGKKVFETLVQQGETFESKTKQAAIDTAAAAGSAARSTAKGMQAMAGGTWDKLEQVFEDRVARALSKLGVHTQNDVARLAERVDALSERVNELIKATGAQKERRGARTPKTAEKAAKKGAKSAQK